MIRPFVLILEDEPDVADLLAWTVREAGYAAQVVQTVDQLLGRMVDRPAAGILVDLHLPNQDTLRLFSRLKKEPVLPWVMIVSGFDDGIRANALGLAESHGFQVIGHIGKPFSPALLKAALPAPS